MHPTPNKRKAAAALREIIEAARKYVEAEQAIVADLKSEQPTGRKNKRREAAPCATAK
jgi:hypothetical protein